MWKGTSTGVLKRFTPDSSFAFNNCYMAIQRKMREQDEGKDIRSKLNRLLAWEHFGESVYLDVE